MKRIIKSIAVITLIALMLTLISCVEISEKKEIEGAEYTDGEKTDSKEEDYTVPTIEEQVLFEYNGFKVTAKSIEEDSFFGTNLKLLIENDGDKALTLTCDNLAVNDYMISDLLIEEVTPGKKSNTDLLIFDSELGNAGIEKIGKVDIWFRLYDPDTYDTVYTAPPVTVKTSYFDTMDTEPQDIGNVLYDDKGVKIVGKYVNENSIWGTSVVLYIENNTGKNIMVRAEDLSVNGFMITEFFASSILDGKKSVDTILLSDSDLEENGIENVESVEVSFRIYDDDTYDGIVKTDPIVFNVK